MKKKDDYILGAHHYWIHFWCGLIVGAGFGAPLAWRIFDTDLARVASTTGVALILALCCGRWGESAWEVIASIIGRETWFL